MGLRVSSLGDPWPVSLEDREGTVSWNVTLREEITQLDVRPLWLPHSTGMCHSWGN